MGIFRENPQPQKEKGSFIQSTRKILFPDCLKFQTKSN
jgi:hypothetical protein